MIKQHFRNHASLHALVCSSHDHEVEEEDGGGNIDVDNNVIQNIHFHKDCTAHGIHVIGAYLLSL